MRILKITTDKNKPLRRSGILPLLLFVFLFFVSGCDPIVQLKGTFPEENERVAKLFFDDLIRGDIDKAKDSLSEKSLGEETDEHLKELSEKMRRSELRELRLARFSHVKGLFNKNERSLFTYEFIFSEGFGVANIVVDFYSGERMVKGIYYEPLSLPLAEVNRFTLEGKGVRHYTMLALVVGVPLFVIVMMIHCVITKGRRSALWLLGMFLGIGNLSLNWTSGEVAFNIISISSLWAPGIRDGMSGAWYVSFAFPAVAFAYLFVMRKR